MLTLARSDAAFSLSTRAIASVGLVLVAAFACSRQRAPTYYEDVAPILAEECLGCHAKRGVAPTPLLETYEEVRSAAGKLRLAVQSRDMPPWGADDTGLCGEWQGAHWLADEQIRTLVAWTSDPKLGDRTRSKPLPSRPPAVFRASGTVLDPGGDWRPGLGASAYRCFIVDPGLSRDRLVTAFRVVSTEPRSVEQITVYELDSPVAEQSATELDAESEGLGYTCYGSSRVSDAHLVTSWTWDSSVLRLPSGVGVRLRGGRKLVVQIHYNPVATGLDVPTRTRIELELTAGVKEASFLPVGPGSFRLPPGLGHAETKVETPVSRSMSVLGVAPRMHTLGKTMQLDVLRNSASKCVGNFDHWNFYRQRLFEYAAPVRLEAGDVVRVSCVYNTQSRSEPTEMGERIDQEECLASLLVME